MAIARMKQVEVACLFAVFCVCGATPWSTLSQVKLENVADVSVSPSGIFTAYTISMVVGDASPNLAPATRVVVIAKATAHEASATQSFDTYSTAKFAPNSKSLSLMANGTVFVSALNGQSWGQPVAVSDIASEGAPLHTEWSPDSTKLAISVAPMATPLDAIAREIGEDIIIDVITGTPNAPNNKLCIVDLSMGVSASTHHCLNTKGSVGFTNWHISCWPYDSQFKWAPNGNDIAVTYAANQFSNDWTQTGVAILTNVSSSSSPKMIDVGYNTTFQPMYNEDGSLLAFTTTDSGDYVWAQTWHVCVMIMKTGNVVCDTKGTRDQMPTLAGWSGGNLVYSEQNSVDMGLYSLPISSDGTFGKWVHVPLQSQSFKGPGVVGGGFRSTSAVTVTKMDSGNTVIGFTYEEFLMAQQAFTGMLNVETGIEVTQVSKINSNVNHDFIKPTVVTWKSDDGLAVEGILTTPAGAGPHPLVVFTHCGPAMSVMATFVGYGSVCARFPLASLVESGIAVLQPNYRGSIGYGKTFRRADQNDWGGRDYDDVMTGVLSLIKQGVADKDRVAHMGWSYGGYMSALAMGTAKTTHGIDFKAFVTGGTLTDLISHTGTTDISKIIESWAGGYYFNDENSRLKMMMDHSGMYHISNATAPTLMFHGIDDPRMPISQSFQLHYALQQRGIPVKFLTFPGSGHIPGNQNQIIRVWDESLAWLTKYINPTATTAA